MTTQRSVNTAVLVLFAAAAGWFAHTDRHVQAAEVYPGPTTFQLQGTGPDAQLAVYDYENRTLSVYQRVGSGSDTKQCSYRLVLGRSGSAIHRQVCAPGRLP